MLQRKCYALFAKGHSILAIRQLNQDVRVRFAPSPTGNIHLGSLRTALYNYLFARKHGGKFLLRIEDTDQTRLVSKSVDQIHRILKFYGLTVDEGPEVGGSYGPYVQSERLGLYQTESDRLIDSGHAYRCFCSEQRLELLRKNAIRSNTIPKYDKKCRSISQKESLQRVANSEPFVVRFKMDRQDIDFKDEVFGPITQTLDESDMIILKSDGYPTYHMANIVDDSAMKISHVIRGMEWLSSTGKHALLYRAFDRPPPKFVHLPLITRDGKRKLSKRDKDSFVDYYSETLGALPIAVLNLMIRNGSGIVDFDPGRLYSLDEMAVSFDEKLVGKRNLQLDEDALRRLSRLAFQRTATAELVGVIRAKIAADVPSSRACLEDDYLVNIIEFLKSNEERFAYLSELTTGQFSWFLNKPTSAEKILTAFDRESTVKCLQELQSIDSWSNDSLKGVASNCAISFPKLLAVLRYALIDSKSGPPIQELIDFFTLSECKIRISQMLSLLHTRSC